MRKQPAVHYVDGSGAYCTQCCHVSIEPFGHRKNPLKTTRDMFAVTCKMFGKDQRRANEKAAS